MEIQITPKDFGGTEFLAHPSRLHLGAQNAAGVDRLTFHLPEAWKNLPSPSTSGTATAAWRPPSCWTAAVPFRSTAP